MRGRRHQEQEEDQCARHGVGVGVAGQLQVPPQAAMSAAEHPEDSGQVPEPQPPVNAHVTSVEQSTEVPCAQSRMVLQRQVVHAPPATNWQKSAPGEQSGGPGVGVGVGSHATPRVLPVRVVLVPLSRI